MFDVLFSFSVDNEPPKPLLYLESWCAVPNVANSNGPPKNKEFTTNGVVNAVPTPKDAKAHKLECRVIRSIP